MTNIFFLADFSVIRPEPGLTFWTLLIFLLIWGILGKMAFKPIQNALKKREGDIQTALDEAKKARDEMSNLKAKNEELLIEAREERTKMLREAKEMKEAIVTEAKAKAKEEAHRVLENAKLEIDNLRMAAMIDLKNQSGLLAIQVAEKILQRELKGDAERDAYVKTLVDGIKLN